MASPLPPRWYDWRKGPGRTSPVVSRGMKMTNTRCPAVNGMCGRFSLVSEIGELQGRFEFAATDLPHAPRYNIAPSQPLLAVLNGGERRAAHLRWGLIPSWAKSASVGSRLINARAETVAERPSFRTALARRRCLVLADGFYEWQRTGKARKPMRIIMKSGEPFAFAGLWDSWRDPEGEIVRSCTIITTAANELLRPVHERMPVILPREMESFWLDRDVEDPEALAQALVPYPSELMEAYEVSSLVNRPGNDGPEVIVPVAEQGAPPGDNRSQPTLI